MSRDYKPKPPPLMSKAIVVPDEEEEDNGATEQLSILCEYMTREFLGRDPSEINAAFATYGENMRDIYDMVIWTINTNPDIMKSKRKFSKMNT